MQGLSAGQAQQGGDDGICSQDGSGSGSRMGSGSRGSNEQYKGPPITVELMESHNKEMEQKIKSLADWKNNSGDIKWFLTFGCFKITYIAKALTMEPKIEQVFALVFPM